MTNDKINVPAIQAWAHRKNAAKKAPPGAAVKAAQAAPLPPQAPPVVETATDVVPLAGFAMDSHRDGKAELRFNGWPGEQTVADCKAAGLQWDKNQLAWWGEASQVVEAAGTIEERNGDGTVRFYDARPQGLAAWAGSPRRSEGRKARGQRSREPRQSAADREAAAEQRLAKMVAELQAQNAANMAALLGQMAAMAGPKGKGAAAPREGGG